MPVIENSATYDKFLTASTLTQKGINALLSGDNITASRCFCDAAAIILNISKHFSGESRMNLLLQAAELYFDACDYKQCLSTASSLGDMGSKLTNEANKRAQSQHAQSMRALVKMNKEKGNYDIVFDLLRNNIHIYDPIEFAKIRAECCEAMGQKELADKFRSDIEYLKGI